MTTAISDFYETLRFLLQDHDSTVQLYPDAVLASAVRSTLRLQRVRGYAVDVDESQIAPPVSDPNKWALIAYHTVQGFVANNPDRYSYKTRAMSESFGSMNRFLDDLRMNIYKLENGSMFSGWHSYCAWFSGCCGCGCAPQLVLVQYRITGATWIEPCSQA